jgi:hypothetical protein
VTDGHACPLFCTCTVTGLDNPGGAHVSAEAGDGATSDADTTAVGMEVAVADPAEFDAVTCIRIVAPTSLAESEYDACVAPPTSRQLPPLESHRFHWYAYDNGVVPFHEPVVARNVCPS